MSDCVACSKLWNKLFVPDNGTFRHPLASIGGGSYLPAFNDFLDVLAAEILSRKKPA